MSRGLPEVPRDMLQKYVGPRVFSEDVPVPRSYIGMIVHFVYIIFIPMTYTYIYIMYVVYMYHSYHPRHSVETYIHTFYSREHEAGCEDG